MQDLFTKTLLGEDMKNQMEERSIKQVLLRSKINGQTDFVI